MPCSSKRGCCPLRARIGPVEAPLAMPPVAGSGSHHAEVAHAWSAALSAVVQEAQAFTMVQPLMFDATTDVNEGEGFKVTWRELLEQGGCGGSPPCFLIDLRKGCAADKTAHGASP